MTPSTTHPIRSIPLSSALTGQSVAFVALAGGGAALLHRLAELGLTPGRTMHVIRHSKGPFIVSIRGVRMALGLGMVRRMLVRPL